MSLGTLVTLTLLAASAIFQASAATCIIPRGKNSARSRIKVAGMTRSYKKHINVPAVIKSADREGKIAPNLAEKNILEEGGLGQEAQPIVKTYDSEVGPENLQVPYFMAKKKNGDLNPCFMTYNDAFFPPNGGLGISYGSDDDVWIDNAQIMGERFPAFLNLAQETTSDNTEALKKSFLFFMRDEISEFCDPELHTHLMDALGRNPLNLAMTLLWNMDDPDWCAMIENMGQVLGTNTLEGDLVRVSAGLSLSSNQVLTSWDEEILNADTLKRYKDLCLVLAFMATWSHLERDIDLQADFLAQKLKYSADPRVALMRHLHGHWSQDAAVSREILNNGWNIRRSYVPVYRWERTPSCPGQLD